MLFFRYFLNALPATLHLPRIRRGQEECEGSFISRGRLPASQPTSKRLSFHSLLVFLSDRITLSHNIHERCSFNIPEVGRQHLFFRNPVRHLFRLEPPRVSQGVSSLKAGTGGLILIFSIASERLYHKWNFHTDFGL